MENTRITRIDILPGYVQRKLLDKESNRVRIGTGALYYGSSGPCNQNRKQQMALVLVGQ
jgi:hypothetical protein